MTPISEPLGQAIQCHQDGRLAEAEALYRQILATTPDDPAALHLLGVIAHQMGRHAESLDLILKALSQKPLYPAALSSLGNTMCALGRLEEAVECYRSTLALQPSFVDAHLNLGNALHDLGRLDEAVQSYRRALAIDPKLAAAHCNLGNSLRDRGDLADAAASYQRALALAHSSQEIYLSLGGVLHDLGSIDKEVATYRKAVTLWPEFAEAHRNLGAALLDMGQLWEAMASCRRALELSPANAGAWFNLALALYQSGDSTGALAPLRRSLELTPQHPETWALFGDAFASALELPIDVSLLPTLMTLLDQPNVHPGSLSRPILTLLRHLPPLIEVMDSSISDALPTFGEAILKLAGSPLLLRVLELAPVIDVEVERLLTRLRRKLLLSVSTQDLRPEAWPFLAALALQCFVNEYVFDETSEETAEVAHLQAMMADRMATGEAIPPSWVATMGAYRPLHEMPWAEALVCRIWPQEVQTLLIRQVFEPQEEQVLRNEVPALTNVRDLVSKAVQAQYEENPYPRWVRTRKHELARPIHTVLQSLRPPLDLGGWTAPDLPEILIAGCGTGEHAINIASRFIHRRILAVDLSRASLGYASRKSRELGITSIEFAQADILALGCLEQRFDLIESAGVLHHMADPLAGWRVLADLLNPGGLMRIALYSEAARQPVVRARARIAEQDWKATSEGIRRFRQFLINESTEPELDWLRSVRDFFSLSECRDLLFHVQEHRFTLPRIETCLSDLGLRFLGFEAPPNIWAEFQAFDPDPNSSASLAAWHRFEQHYPDTFKGMYQFWCQKA